MLVQNQTLKRGGFIFPSPSGKYIRPLFSLFLSPAMRLLL
jgi:hypothetical protein